MSIFKRTRRTSEAGRTALNPEIQNNSTVLNPDIQSGATVLNPEINPGISEDAFITAGTQVLGKYRIKRELNVSTGEADLFICTYNGQEYVAKIYRRQMAIKPEVTRELGKINSPYVAKVYDMGEYEGYPVEIIPYYKNGSLQGRTFGVEQLKKYIIPSLNTGLNVLHSHGIIHKDLKPSNIMLNADGKTVAIIDFGISTVAQNGSTVVVTHTGLTPEYSAPETFRSVFLAESDYYSLGITLFELYLGHSPYYGLTQEQIAQFSVIQKVPLPDNMDAELKTLITALTYNDITNRHNKSNPNRRWTYEEVNNWLKGVNQPLPGSTAGEADAGEFRAYRFQGKSYNTMTDLVTALATDWENGKKQLMRGMLGGHFNSINAEIATICSDAQDALDEGDKSADLVFFETIYKLCPDMPKLFWKGRVFNDLDELGRGVLAAARTGNADMDALIGEMLANGILSTYIESVRPAAKAQIITMKAFESAHRTFESKGKQRLRALCGLGYMLVNKKLLEVNGQVFADIDELTCYLSALSEKSYEAFDAFSRKLIRKNYELDIMFECWLAAIGKQKAVDEWRKELGA